MAGDPRVLVDLGNDLQVWRLDPHEMREQEVNAHIMPPEMFDALVRNVKKRGRLESMPYCARPGNEGLVEIVSGHHRVRAAVAAGLEAVDCLVDLAKLSRSQIVAKQLAHNAIVGYDEEELLRQLLVQIDSADDFIETGLPESLLPGVEGTKMQLFSPSADFQWKTVTFSFLSHQMDDFKKLLDATKDAADLLGAVPEDQFDAFLDAAAAYARFHDVRNVGTVVALLTKEALRSIEENADGATDEAH